MTCCVNPSRKKKLMYINLLYKKNNIMSMMRTYSPKQLSDETQIMLNYLYRRAKMNMSKRCDASENFYLQRVLDMHELICNDMLITLNTSENMSLIEKISLSLTAIERHFFGETDGLESCHTVKDCIDKTKSIQHKLYEPVRLCGFTA